MAAPAGRAHPKNALRGHKYVSRGQRPRELGVAVDNVRGNYEDSQNRPEGAKACRNQLYINGKIRANSCNPLSKKQKKRRAAEWKSVFRLL